VTAKSECGDYLDACTCNSRSPARRSPRELQARHEASVARARRSGWASRPIPAYWIFQQLLPDCWVTFGHLDSRPARSGRAARPTPTKPAAVAPADPTGRRWVTPVAEVIRNVREAS
jgi:hypothetical protein